MHGVAAKVAQEVIVLFQDNNLDAGAGKQQRMDQAGGTTTGDTDLGLNNSRDYLTLPCERVLKVAPAAAQLRWSAI